jgi:hypothetical protein
MSREKPNIYTAEFRASAVKLANESDKPIVPRSPLILASTSILYIPGLVNIPDATPLIIQPEPTIIFMMN